MGRVRRVVARPGTRRPHCRGRRAAHRGAPPVSQTYGGAAPSVPKHPGVPQHELGVGIPAALRVARRLNVLSRHHLLRKNPRQVNVDTSLEIVPLCLLRCAHDDLLGPSWHSAPPCCLHRRDVLERALKRSQGCVLTCRRERGRTLSPPSALSVRAHGGEGRTATHWIAGKPRPDRSNWATMAVTKCPAHDLGGCRARHRSASVRLSATGWRSPRARKCLAIHCATHRTRRGSCRLARGHGAIARSAWVPLCLAGIAAGTIGLARDQRVAWRSIAALGALVSLVGTGAPSLVIWLISG